MHIKSKYIYIILFAIIEYYLTQVINKGVFLVSLMGNRGTFTKPIQVIITDFEFMYHMVNLGLCVSGILFHEFFYSLLVSLYLLFISCDETQKLWCGIVDVQYQWKNQINYKNIVLVRYIHLKTEEAVSHVVIGSRLKVCIIASLILNIYGPQHSSPGWYICCMIIYPL